MSKKKIHDLNDIIDTAYVAADYSHGNGYYDKATDHDIIKRNRSFGQSRGQLQEQSRFGSTNNDTFRNDNNNIFLKNSQSNVNNASNTDKNESTKIDLNDDNFPSLGSKPIQSVKNNNSNSVEHK